MLDLISVALILALFAVVGLVVKGVERLGPPAPKLPGTPGAERTRE